MPPKSVKKPMRKKHLIGGTILPKLPGETMDDYTARRNYVIWTIVHKAKYDYPICERLFVLMDQLSNHLYDFNQEPLGSYIKRFYGMIQEHPRFLTVDLVELMRRRIKDRFPGAP